MGFTFDRTARRAAVASFAAGLSATASFSLSAQATVRGVLYDDANGSPIIGTVMLVDPSTDAAVVYSGTDSSGRFTLRVRDGVYQIAAIHPGYTRVLSRPVPLATGELLTIRIPIAENGDPHNQVGVLEHVRPGERSAAAAPSRASNGLPGQVATRRALGTGLQYSHDELVRNGQTTLGDFLRGVPGLSLSDPDAGSSMQMSRSAGFNALSMRGPAPAACHVGWFIDGHRMDMPGRSDPLTDGLVTMRLETIEAVEVFRGLSEMPAEFAEPDLRCGAIAVWTRRG